MISRYCKGKIRLGQVKKSRNEIASEGARWSALTGERQVEGAGKGLCFAADWLKANDDNEGNVNIEEKVRYRYR